MTENIINLGQYSKLTVNGAINFNYISQYPVTFVVIGEVFLMQYILVHVVGSCTREECIMAMHVCLACACFYSYVVSHLLVYM